MRHLLLLLTCLVWSIGATAAPPAPDLEEGEPLLGKWQRPDGGYVIAITSVHPAGTLQAAYFNPRPINVETARWRFGGGYLQVRIDLNDQGYEGSLYFLRYDASTDTLTGLYQPAGQQPFEVTFRRLAE